MLITTIIIADEWHPVEVQAWLDANLSAVIKFISFKDNLLYIFYE